MIATRLGWQDHDEATRILIAKFFGHSPKMNEDVYQTPAIVKSLTKIVPALTGFAGTVIFPLVWLILSLSIAGKQSSSFNEKNECILDSKYTEEEVDDPAEKSFSDYSSDSCHSPGL